MGKKRTKSKTPTVEPIRPADCDRYAESLVRRGLASPLILGRSTRSKGRA